MAVHVKWYPHHGWSSAGYPPSSGGSGAEWYKWAPHTISDCHRQQTVKVCEARKGAVASDLECLLREVRERDGCLVLIGMRVADLEKEIQEMEFNEKDDQEEYEQMIEDSAAKRASDSKSLTDKEAAKADAEANCQTLKDDTQAKMNRVEIVDSWRRINIQ